MSTPTNPPVKVLPSASDTEGRTGMMSVANTWLLAREDAMWVGPIEVDTDPDVVVSFAVVPLRTRPASTDWFAPVQSPDDPTQVGYMLPVASPGRYGLWVRGVRGLVTIILEPAEVGYITRT